MRAIKRRPTPFAAVAVSVAFLILGGWLIWSFRPLKEKLPDQAAETPPFAPPPPLASAPKGPFPSSPSPQSHPAFAPSELLLKAPAGSFAAQAAFDAVLSFTTKSPEALAELSRLGTSADPVERLLALHLQLEIFGPTDAILASAASDPSPWVSAQAAEWLFFHEKFDLWHQYLRNVHAKWASFKTDEIVARLALSSSGATELPSGLVILQLGRALPDFISALLAQAPDLRVALTDALLDADSPSAARTRLLDIFHQVRPDGYLAILETLIARRAEDSSARFQAFVRYATAASISDDLARLDAVNASATLGIDPLADRFEVARRLLTERASAADPATILTQARATLAPALTAATSLHDLSAAERQQVQRYLTYLRITPPGAGDAALLQRIATLLRAEPARDYSARQLTAQASYLANQAGR